MQICQWYRVCDAGALRAEPLGHPLYLARSKRTTDVYAFVGFAKWLLSQPGRAGDPGMLTALARLVEPPAKSVEEKRSEREQAHIASREGGALLLTPHHMLGGGGGGHGRGPPRDSWSGPPAGP